MSISKPVYRGLLIFEFVAAYAVPFIFLVMATILAFSVVATFLINPRLEALVVISFVIGGYVGMLGLYRQLVFLIYDDEKLPDLCTFVFTLIGCIAVLPLTWLAVETGEVLSALVGLAPILVAIQLTFMNRQQLFELWKHK